jgi:hypothetical protein
MDRDAAADSPGGSAAFTSIRYKRVTLPARDVSSNGREF